MDQFSSVAQSRLTLHNPMDGSLSGLLTRPAGALLPSWTSLQPRHQKAERERAEIKGFPLSMFSNFFKGKQAPLPAQRLSSQFS